MIDIFCVASGPSLTKRDCDLIAASGAKIIAVNKSWEMFERLDFFYAGDLKFWKEYYKQINIPVGEKWTCAAAAAKMFNLNLHNTAGPFNSGMRAIQLAILKGFRTIGLLGYDCSLAKGSHWHGAYEKPQFIPVTQRKVDKWQVQFLKVVKQARIVGARIYNCSRHTELACFPLMDLEDVVQ
jgi:hypothetical protein